MVGRHRRFLLGDASEGGVARDPGAGDAALLVVVAGRRGCPLHGWRLGVSQRQVSRARHLTEGGEPLAPVLARYVATRLLFLGVRECRSLAPEADDHPAAESNRRRCSGKPQRRCPARRHGKLLQEMWSLPLNGRRSLRVRFRAILVIFIIKWNGSKFSIEWSIAQCTENNTLGVIKILFVAFAFDVRVLLFFLSIFFYLFFIYSLFFIIYFSFFIYFLSTFIHLVHHFVFFYMYLFSIFIF